MTQEAKHHDDAAMKAMTMEAMTMEAMTTEEAAASTAWTASIRQKKNRDTWPENDGRAERPGLRGLAVPALNSSCAMSTRYTLRPM
jgi:hypothetical protein